MISDRISSWFLHMISCPQTNRGGANIEGLSDLTIVIPSYQRQEYLLRAILPWIKSEVKLVLLDGSDDPLPMEIKHALDSFHNVTYVHDASSLGNRMKLGSKHLSTKYIVTMGDDEFFINRGVLDVISALNKDPDLVGCIGLSVTFGLVGRENLVYGSGYPHQGYSIYHDHFGDRLVSAMKEYNAATCYAVLTRDCWIRSWGSTGEWSSPYVNEIKQACSTYILGKFKSINSLYWLRSYEVPPVHDNIRFNRRIGFSEWWTNSSYANEHNMLITLLSTELMEVSSISYSAAKESIINIINMYFEFEQNERHLWRLSLSRTQKILTIIRRLMRKALSDNSIDYIKSAIGLPTNNITQVGFDLGSLEHMISTNCSGAYVFDIEAIDDMRYIESLIKDFNHQLDN